MLLKSETMLFVSRLPMPGSVAAAGDVPEISRIGGAGCQLV